MAVGRGEEPRKTREAKEPLMDTNGHEWIEPRMDTNGHEWTRMAVAGGRNHERHGKPKNHEWTRNDECQGRFSTLRRPRPVDFQAELEKLNREREQDEESAGLEDLREIVNGDTP